MKEILKERAQIEKEGEEINERLTMADAEYERCLDQIEEEREEMFKAQLGIQLLQETPFVSVFV
jgi:cell fate regulator YaaT (PSP1 superfamily)